MQVVSKKCTFHIILNAIEVSLKWVLIQGGGGEPCGNTVDSIDPNTETFWTNYTILDI